MKWVGEQDEFYIRSHSLVLLVIPSIVCCLSMKHYVTIKDAKF